ncbi:MAG: ribose-phosphate pyrophosphokinase [Tistlia sp.]|uniref:ribose-phosphate diphosphokinase n=1 Tax=Tistlia sp. TaxID=3057121 RepID=UPI0034A37F9A
MKLFALDASRSFGEAVADALGLPLAAHEEREFEDGEHKARPLEGVRGADVYVVQSLHGGPEQSVHDKLVRLLFFLAALRDQGAGRLTAVVPYLAYGRKDRRTKARDPITTRYVAQLFEAAGIDRIVTLEVHNIAAFENAFRCETVHLDTRPIFARVARTLAGEGELVVASPDPGGVKRAQLFREYLEADLGRPLEGAFLEKRRTGGVVTGERVVGEVEGRTVLVIDDLISTGGTMARAARACRALGARRVHALAAHGLFVGEASQAMADPALDRSFVSDSVPPFRLAPELLERRVEVVSAAPLFAEALRRLHDNGSISDLLALPEA